MQAFRADFTTTFSCPLKVMLLPCRFCDKMTRLLIVQQVTDYLVLKIFVTQNNNGEFGGYKLVWRPLASSLSKPRLSPVCVEPYVFSLSANIGTEQSQGAQTDSFTVTACTTLLCGVPCKRGDLAIVFPMVSQRKLRWSSIRVGSRIVFIQWMDQPQHMNTKAITWISKIALHSHIFWFVKLSM